MKYAPNQRMRDMIAKIHEHIATNHPQWLAMSQQTRWVINDRMHLTLGLANILHRIIEISGDHASGASDDELMNTLTHELAHILAYAFHGDRGHGLMWAIVHRKLGGNGARVSYKVSHVVKRNVVKRIIVERNGKEYKITLRAWNAKRIGYLQCGYSYVRTEEIDNGTVRVIHQREVHPNYVAAFSIDVSPKVS